MQVTYRHFAFIGQESEWAAVAADCAGEQGKFWTFADYVFTHQAGENVGAFSRANLKRFATQVGLDMNAFNACFDGNKYIEAVKQDSDRARQRGIRSTPSFFINGQFMEGLPPTDQFTRLIDSMQPR